jgi:predicted MFS family arabinose efflux permease
MPVTQSLALALAQGRREGEKLGKLGAAQSVAAIAGSAMVWAGFRLGGLDFPVLLMVAAAAAGLAALGFLSLRPAMPKAPHGPSPRLVVKKRYGLYYILSITYGARKQLFITFGPWVLVRIFGQPATTLALLWMLATILKVVLLPVVGRLIDRVGERAVLMADAVLLLAVCLAYGFAPDLLPAKAAFLTVCAAYVVDQVLFPVQMARATYLSKIAETRGDLSGTISLGISIDHAVSIPVAMLGGRLWQASGSQRPVFVAAAFLALLILVACAFIRVRRIEHPELVEQPEKALADVRPERI